MGENTHVAFDAELCAANPEAAADKIAELEHALACAGGLDRTRVIVIEDLRKRLSEALHMDGDISILLANIDAVAEATGEGPEGEDAVLVEQIRADHKERRAKALSDVAENDAELIGTPAGRAPRNASGLCATCVDEEAVRAGEVADEASQELWRQSLDQERVEDTKYGR